MRARELIAEATADEATDTMIDDGWSSSRLENRNGTVCTRLVRGDDVVLVCDEAGVREAVGRLLGGSRLVESADPIETVVEDLEDNGWRRVDNPNRSMWEVRLRKGDLDLVLDQVADDRVVVCGPRLAGSSISVIYDQDPATATHQGVVIADLISHIAAVTGGRLIVDDGSPVVRTRRAFYGIVPSGGWGSAFHSDVVSAGGVELYVGVRVHGSDDPLSLIHI